MKKKESAKSDPNAEKTYLDFRLTVYNFLHEIWGEGDSMIGIIHEMIDRQSGGKKRKRTDHPLEHIYRAETAAYFRSQLDNLKDKNGPLADYFKTMLSEYNVQEAASMTATIKNFWEEMLQTPTDKKVILCDENLKSNLLWERLGGLDGY